MAQTFYETGKKVKNIKTGQITTVQGVQDIGGGKMGQAFSDDYQLFTEPVAEATVNQPTNQPVAPIGGGATGQPPGGIGNQATPNENLYIGATNWANLQQQYSPEQLAYATMTVNGKKYWSPNVNIADFGKTAGGTAGMVNTAEGTDLADEIDKYLNGEMGTDILENATTNPKTQIDIQNLLEKIQSQNKTYQDSILSKLTPTQDEITLRTQLADVANEIQQTQLSAQAGVTEVEGKIEPMSFITGASAQIFKQANIQLNTLQLKEANLLNRLEIQTDLREQDLEALKAGYGFMQDNWNLQLQVYEKIQAEEEKVYQRNQDLNNKQKSDLEMILNLTAGADYSELSPTAQSKINLLATRLGIPMDAVINSMKVAKDKYLAEQATGVDKTITVNGRILGLDKLGNVIKDYGSAYKESGSGGGGGGMITTLSTGEVDVSKLSPEAQAIISGTLRLEDLTPTVRGKIAGELTAAGYQSGPKLSAGQQELIATMDTVADLADQVIDYNNDGKLEGIGAFGLGTLKSGLAQIGIGGEEGQAVRALIGNIKGTVAKLRGGTSFTPNEEKLLESYTPSINDSPAIAINKLNLLKDFIDKLKINTLSSATERKVINEATDIGNAKVKYNLTY